ncbi:unnamed protein product [Rotaria magnacalcarata]|uniref:Uncharacterized protein n=1 Tax=Rotaria magnacalcarata TaxID=392030 RepID=A0A816ERW6_9BILA|nr:unnamed protein product [Rotaria magnacalcarata]
MKLEKYIKEYSVPHPLLLDISSIMKTSEEPNRCSICDKTAAKCTCAGCKSYFCVKHFNEHRQQLSMKFDVDIKNVQEELLTQINQLDKPITPSAELLSQIDQWESETIENVHERAVKLRYQLTELVNQDRNQLINQYKILTNEINTLKEDDDFAEDDIERLRTTINQIQISLEQLITPSKTKFILVENNEIDWNHLINVEEKTKLSPLYAMTIDPNAKWKPNGDTIAGGNGAGTAINQLARPSSLYIDHDRSIFIADSDNHRIVRWKNGATQGEIVAGGHGEGYRNEHLYSPTDLIIDDERDSLIICDYNNLRLVRWPRRNGKQGEVIISGIRCIGLTMDNNGAIYIADNKKHEVVRYQPGERCGTVLAGGNGSGNRLDQLQCPRWLFVDQDHSVYVSDNENHRVMKWIEGAQEGIVVAGGHGLGSSLAQLSHPCGIVVDDADTIYVADSWNNRIMRWPKGATQGSVVIGGNGRGDQPDQLNQPTGLSFDRHGNLYIIDQCNHRVQKFHLDSTSCL